MSLRYVHQLLKTDKKLGKTNCVTKNPKKSHPYSNYPLTLDVFFKRKKKKQPGGGYSKSELVNRPNKMKTVNYRKHSINQNKYSTHGK